MVQANTLARSVALASALTFSLVRADSPIINTPASLVECQPAALAWSGGTAPYYIAVIPGGQSSATALENLPEQSGTSYTWTVDIASGTSVSFKITDSTGTVNYSDQVTVQAGTSSSCLSSSGSSSAASSSSAAASSSSSSRAASSSSSAAASSSKAASSSSAASSASSSSSSKASSSSAATTSAASSSAASSSTSSSSSTAPTATSSTSGAGKLAASLAGLVGAAAVAAFAL